VSYESTIIDFLQEKEKFLVSLEISEHIEKVKEKLAGKYRKAMGEETQGRSYINDVMAFLEKEENFGVAMEISEHTEEVRKKLVGEYWRAVEKKAGDFLGLVRGDKKVSDSWKVLTEEDKEGASYMTTGIYLEQINDNQEESEEDPAHLWFGVEYGGANDKREFWLCLQWSDDLEADDETESVQRLLEDLNSDGWRSRKGYPGRKRVCTFESEKAFLVDLVERPGELAESCAASLGEAFKKYVENVEKINAEIAARGSY